MTRLIWVLGAVVFLFIASCDEKDTGITPVNESKTSAGEMPTDPLLIEINEMEARAKTDTVLNRNVGLRLLKAYQDYYNKHPQDTLAISYLFEAARVADAMGKYQKAIDLLVTYHDSVGDQKKKAESAYLVAFIYDAHLHNTEKAIEHYNRVIELYPESLWATQAKDALHLVGKSDKELLEFLDKKKGAAQ